jgi:hypothetical protein
LYHGCIDDNRTKGATMKTFGCVLALGLLLGLPPMSQADLIFTLDTPLQKVHPGATLTFTGTLINLNGPTLFLNGDNFTLDGVGLTLDDTPFLLNAPTSLASGDSFVGTLFTVAADPTTLPQQALGSFTIIGGLTETGQSPLATQEFQVTVVPEPGSLALLCGLGVMGTSLLRRKRRR